MARNNEITIYDIARKLEISPATVSRGLKNNPRIGEETRRRIQQAAKKMGYQHNLFASNLRRQHTNTLGVIIPRLNSYFMSSVISGMEKIANASGYHLIITQSQESFEKECANVTTLFNSRVDGLMVSLASDSIGDTHFDLFRKKKIPVIFFDRVPENTRHRSVVIDNRRAGYDATLHLINQGCKDIVHFGGPLNRNVYADRFAGFKKALRSVGLTFDKHKVFANVLTEEDARTAVIELLQRKKLPDGIFACNDTVAAVCVQELREAGVSIPKQVAIVGFNNDPLSRFIEPKLTTVYYPGRTMGELVASTLIAALAGQSTTKEKTLTIGHELIVRKSSLKKTKTDKRR